MPKKTEKPKAKPKNKPQKSTKTEVKFTKLPNVLNLATTSWLVIWRNRNVFSVIALIFGLAYLFLVLGLSSPANVNGINGELSSITHGHLSSLYSGFSVFTYLAGSTAKSSSAQGSTYQSIIIIIASLSIIWALRQTHQGAKFRARDSYYQGMYPLIQYIIVFLFILLEFLPMALGFALYALLVNGNIAVSSAEKFASALLSLGLLGVSLYLITPSVIALYISTLPKMTPLLAIRSAKQLVKGRRWTVFRKMLFLPLVIFVAAAAVIFPFIIVIPVISPWLFFIFTLIALVYIHSYLYNLYRELIDD